MITFSDSFLAGSRKNIYKPTDDDSPVFVVDEGTV